LREGVDVFEFLGFKIGLDIRCDNATSNMDSDINKQQEFSYIVLYLGQDAWFWESFNSWDDNFCDIFLNILLEERLGEDQLLEFIFFGVFLKDEKLFKKVTSTNHYREKKSDWLES
jgi:hypothetical protein